MQQLQVSARAYHRILKLARTVADLARSENIQTPQITDRHRGTGKGAVGGKDR
jgi:predicted ATPase with chaperone activity